MALKTQSDFVKMKFTKKFVRLFEGLRLLDKKMSNAVRSFSRRLNYISQLCHELYFTTICHLIFLNDQLCTSSLKFGDISNLRQADR